MSTLSSESNIENFYWPARWLPLTKLSTIFSTIKLTPIGLTASPDGRRAMDDSNIDGKMLDFNCIEARKASFSFRLSEFVSGFEKLGNGTCSVKQPIT